MSQIEYFVSMFYKVEIVETNIFSLFSVSENRKQEVKPNAFSKSSKIENENHFQKMKTGNENKKWKWKPNRPLFFQPGGVTGYLRLLSRDLVH